MKSIAPTKTPDVTDSVKQNAANVVAAFVAAVVTWSNIFLFLLIFASSLVVLV